MRRLIILLGAAVMLCGCSNSADTLRSEKIINWTSYEVTGPHEFTFTANTADPKCFRLRTVVKETDGTLEVAIVEGALPNAPKQCTAVGKIEKLAVMTKAPAQNLDVRALPAEEVKLNP